VIGLDTNVLAQDHARQAAMATRLIENDLSVSRSGFISLVVVAELCWVLNRLYGATMDELVGTLEDLLDTPQFHVERREVAQAAIRRFKAASSRKAGIVDTLIDSEVLLTYNWRGIEIIPPRTLPPKSLVVALTPMMDDRTVDALLDLRARGFDLAVVEIMAEPFTVQRPSDAARLAHRIWQLERTATRLRYRRLGVPIAQWRLGEPLAGPLAREREFGRQNRWLRV